MVGVGETVKYGCWTMKAGHLDYTKMNPSVHIVRHAIAIDERRAYFRQNLWDKIPASGQDVVQVWFPGTHCDVGGGHPEAEAGLSEAPLARMRAEAQIAGLVFNAEAAAHQLPSQPLAETTVADPLPTMHE